MAAAERERSSNTPTLLRTKFAIPRPRPDRVERPRLEKLLDKGGSKTLMVIQSPAGFGKTTLVSDWIGKARRRAAWVSLDESDGEPVRFWSYVAAALDSAVPGLGTGTIGMLSSRQAPDPDLIVTGLLNSVAEHRRELFLVLDDYHLIANETVHNSVDFLLGHAPANLHVVVCTRTEPPLAVAAYRARSSLFELRAADLRFSAAEVAAFFRATTEVALLESDLVSLTEITEGWAAALQLAALSLEGSQDPQRMIASLSGRDEYLFDYLAEEVFGRLDESMRSFLLASSVFDRFCAPLCEAVGALENAGARFELLEKYNLFLIPLDSERKWYRYHHLFRQFLQAQSRRLRGEDEIRRDLLHASEWFHREHLDNEAIQYALEAGSPERAADLIVRAVGAFFQSSELVALRGWLDRLPRQLVFERPTLGFIYAWTLLATGRGTEVAALLEEVEKTLGFYADGSKAGLGASPRIRCALAEISVLRSSLAFSRFDIAEIKTQVFRALDYLPRQVDEQIYNTPRDIRATALFNLALALENEGSVDEALSAFEEALEANRETENIHLVPMIIAHLGNLQLIGGSLSRAADTYRQVVTVSDAGHTSPLAGLAHVGYGIVLLERGLLDEAVEHLEAGIEMGRRWANWEQILPGMLARARIESARGNQEAASAIIDELARAADALKIPVAARSVLDASLALHNIRSGVRVEETLLQAKLALDRHTPFSFLAEPEATTWCRALVEGGDGKSALPHLQVLESAMHTGRRVGRLIEVLLLEANAYMQLSDFEAARSRLDDAIRRAEPEGFLQLFIELGKSVASLLESPAGSDLFRRHLAELLAGGKGRAADGAPMSDGGLSERELEVLRALAGGASNQEAADHLFISLNTIKTHLKNIFAKLEVSRRTQAISRARELGLLDRRPKAEL